MTSNLLDRVMAQAYAVRAELTEHPVVGRYVDASLDIPRPYMGSGDIRLVIIGQDPTVQNEESRATITTVLNLNRTHALRRYLEGICDGLGLSLAEHVYATNASKCFYTAPPTTIAKDDGVDVLQESAPAWLPLLRSELDAFPDAMVISLGEPVLRLLVKEGFPGIMRYYWGYRRRWREGEFGPLSAIEPSHSTLGRTIFPIIHQPSYRKPFYRQRMPDYLGFVKSRSGWAGGEAR